MDLHAIVGNPVTIVAMVLSACLGGVAGVWRAFASGRVVAEPTYQRECDRADKAEAALWRVLGVTEVVIGAANVMLTQRNDEQEAGDDAAT